MEIKRRVSIILLCLVGLAILAAGVGFAQLHRSAPQDLRTVTKEQYDQALAKWRSQGVTEYKSVVKYAAQGGMYFSTWTLHVTDGNIEILDRDVNPPPTDYRNIETREDVRFLTVDSLFADIGRQRKSLENDKAIGFDGGINYVMQFNPDLGYPMIYEENHRYNPNDFHSHINIVELKILKQTTPRSLSPRNLTPEGGDTDVAQGVSPVVWAQIRTQAP